MGMPARRFAVACVEQHVRGRFRRVATNAAGFTTLFGTPQWRLTHGRTISIPRLDCLIAELRGPRQESLNVDSRFRIVEANRRYPRDVALSCPRAEEQRQNQAGARTVS